MRPSSQPAALRSNQRSTGAARRKFYAAAILACAVLFVSLSAAQEVLHDSLAKPPGSATVKMGTVKLGTKPEDRKQPDGTVAVNPDDGTVALKAGQSGTSLTVKMGTVKLGAKKVGDKQPDGTVAVTPDDGIKTPKKTLFETVKDWFGGGSKKPGTPNETKPPAGTVAVKPDDGTVSLKSGQPGTSLTVKMGTVKLGTKPGDQKQPDGTVAIKPDNGMVDLAPGQPGTSLTVKMGTVKLGTKKKDQKQPDGTVAIKPDDGTVGLKPGQGASITVQMGTVKLRAPDADGDGAKQAGPWVLATPPLRYVERGGGEPKSAPLCKDITSPDGLLFTGVAPSCANVVSPVELVFTGVIGGRFCTNIESRDALEFTGAELFSCKNVNTGKALVFNGVTPKPSQTADTVRRGKIPGDVKVSLLRVTPIDRGVGVNPFDFRQVKRAIEEAREVVIVVPPTPPSPTQTPPSPAPTPPPTGPTTPPPTGPTIPPTGPATPLTVSGSPLLGPEVFFSINPAGTSLTVGTTFTPLSQRMLNTAYNGTDTSYEIVNEDPVLIPSFTAITPASGILNVPTGGTTRFVSRRTSDGVHFVINLQVTASNPFASIQVTTVSAFNCGTNAADCP